MKQCWISDPVSVRSCFSPSTHSSVCDGDAAASAPSGVDLS